MTTEATNAIRAQIETDLEEHIDRIQRAIQQPSVSVENHGLRAITELVLEYLEELGCAEATLIETDGAPGVWGYYDAGAEKTIVNYGMLDTRPVGERSAWTHDPFGGEIVETEEYGRTFVGRGSVKCKGPYVAWLNALMATKAALGELPVNILFLIEAEEINGSPHYYDMLDTYGDRIDNADACFSPLASQNAAGDVSLALGYKAALYFTLEVSGEKWGRGPQGGSIHAMSNATVESPAWRLVDALSSLTSDAGTHIDIEGFYDQYEPPTDDERAEMRAFIESLESDGDGEGKIWQSLPGLSRGEGVVENLVDNIHEDPLEAFLTHFYGAESLNIQGLNSGYLGPNTGTKPFIMPGSGGAFLDWRLPRGYDPDIVLEQLRTHLVDNGFEDVTVSVSGKHPWCKTDRHATLVNAVESVLDRYDADLTCWPYSAGGVPWAAFGNRFDIPVLYGVGIGYGGNSEGANEFFAIDGNEQVGGLVDCECAHAEMLLEYAKR